MEFSRRTELLEGVVNQLIDEEALGVCFEMHRAIKLDYYALLYPEDSVYDKQPIVDTKGLDIFGSSPLSIKKNIDCLCPNCSRTLGAQKFAPHLEKCMGMGRNSTRLAAVNKKPKVVAVVAAVESEQESDDNEDEWTYPEAQRSSKGLLKKAKKDGSLLPFSSSSLKSGRGPGRPPKLQKEQKERGQPGSADNAGEFRSIKPSQMMHTVHSFKALPADHKISLLDQICGVVSERTGRLCTRSVNCPQHLEDQRMELRGILLADKRKPPLELTPPPPPKKNRSGHKSPHKSPLETPDGLDEGVHPQQRLHSEIKRKKNKSSKKSKRHGITTTVLQSSPMRY